MSRDAGERHRRGLGQVGDPRVAVTKPDEQGTPGGIGQRRIGPVEHLGIFN